MEKYLYIVMNNSAKTFTITSQPYYDHYNECYKNILMVNTEPQGPIRRIVRRIKLLKLSPFQQDNQCYKKCGLALHSLRGRTNTNCNLMTPDEIPDLITFLTANNYQIETQITNMLNQSEIKLSNQKIGFIVTYYEPNQQPNITYMR
jgi:hypothetical protein